MPDLQRRRWILDSSGVATVSLSGCGGGGSVTTDLPATGQLAEVATDTRRKALAAVQVPDAGVAMPSPPQGTTTAAALGNTQLPNLDNAIVLGHGSTATRSHQMVLGNGETQEVVLAGVTFTKAELIGLLQLARRRG